jgi:hypothetical protein
VFGCPSSLHTDAHTSLTGNVATELASMLHIHRSSTTPYHPQSDGQSERSIRQLIDVANKILSDLNQTEWHKVLPQIQLALNCSVSSVTGFTPNFLEFGRKALLPADFLLGTLPDKDIVGNSVRTLYERQRLIFNKVRQSHWVGMAAQ